MDASRRSRRRSWSWPSSGRHWCTPALLQASGISRYGTGLQPFNGRDALRDLYEELLDAACDIRQAIAERDTAPKRCADCHRRSDDLTLCADEQWRGPSCRKRYEAGAGVQLPIGERP